MSTFKRPGAETYSYDFWVAGVRFFGDTERTTKREAVAVEKDLRDKAKADAETRKKQQAAMDAPQTWGEAATRWWLEVGKHHKAAVTLISLEWLANEIGPNRLLRDIDDNLVAKVVAKRRAQKRKVGKVNERDRQAPVSAATVNRTVTEPIRKVLLRARKVWKVPVNDIDWSAHKLTEPKERVREASQGEEARIMTGLSRGYDAAVRFAFINGCRRMEIVGLKKTDVDFFGRKFTVTGKGGHVRVIPMNTETYKLLWSLKDHPSEYVFTYIAARTDKRKKLVKGERYPITDAGLRTAMKRQTVKAKVQSFRFHDTRHTAATRVLRQSNIKVVQKLLGHADIATTAKYAHAMEEDVRRALEAASPTESPAEAEEVVAKSLASEVK